jgi:hypothetical protein
MAVIAVILTFFTPPVTLAQTTRFTYQGQLTDSGAPQATYQMRFRLFDALSSGSQVGSTIENAAVAVSDGIFTVALDFGAPVFSGADRYLEIAVRRNGGEGYTVLSPRQQIASSPYSIRTLSAQTADVALDANKLGGIDADEYVTNATVGGSFINNGTTLQDADFNIDGNGFVGGTLGIGTTAPGSGLELRGTGLNTQQRITDAASGNSLVLQGGSGSNMKVTGFNYNTSTAQPLYLSTDGAHTFLNPNGGLVGIGMTSPTHALDVHGFFRASHVAGGNVVSQTTGGVNSWAKLWMKTPVQEWSIGSSHNFNGNQLYFSNESAGGIRMAIMPDGNVGIGSTNPPAKLWVQGNVGQNAAGLGLPKAMVYALKTGSINKCYNAVTGSSVPPCGFSSSKPDAFTVRIDFGFPVYQSFFSLTFMGSAFEVGGIWTANHYAALTVNQIDVGWSVESGPGLMVIVY